MRSPSPPPPLEERGGVWSFSAELTGRGQPAGLPEGSRGSFGKRGERPPKIRVGERAPREGCQSCNLVQSSRLTSRSSTPAGVQDICCAVTRRSPPP